MIKNIQKIIIKAISILLFIIICNTNLVAAQYKVLDWQNLTANTGQKVQQTIATVQSVTTALNTGIQSAAVIANTVQQLKNLTSGQIASQLLSNLLGQIQLSINTGYFGEPLYVVGRNVFEVNAAYRELNRQADSLSNAFSAFPQLGQKLSGVIDSVNQDNQADDSVQIDNILKQFSSRNQATFSILCDGKNLEKIKLSDFDKYSEVQDNCAASFSTGQFSGDNASKMEKTLVNLNANIDKSAYTKAVFNGDTDANLAMTTSNYLTAKAEKAKADLEKERDQGDGFLGIRGEECVPGPNQDTLTCEKVITEPGSVVAEKAKKAATVGIDQLAAAKDEGGLLNTLGNFSNALSGISASANIIGDVGSRIGSAVSNINLSSGGGGGAGGAASSPTGNSVPGQGAISNTFNGAPNFNVNKSSGNSVPGQSAVGDTGNYAPNFNLNKSSSNSVPGSAAISNTFNGAPTFGGANSNSSSNNKSSSPSSNNPLGFISGGNSSSPSPINNTQQSSQPNSSGGFWGGLKSFGSSVVNTVTKPFSGSSGGASSANNNQAQNLLSGNTYSNPTSNTNSGGGSGGGAASSKQGSTGNSVPGQGAISNTFNGAPTFNTKGNSVPGSTAVGDTNTYKPNFSTQQSSSNPSVNNKSSSNSTNNPLGFISGGNISSPSSNNNSQSSSQSNSSGWSFGSLWGGVKDFGSSVSDKVSNTFSGSSGGINTSNNSSAQDLLSGNTYSNTDVDPIKAYNPDPYNSSSLTNKNSNSVPGAAANTPSWNNYVFK